MTAWRMLWSAASAKAFSPRSSVRSRAIVMAARDAASLIPRLAATSSRRSYHNAEFSSSPSMTAPNPTHPRLIRGRRTEMQSDDDPRSISEILASFGIRHEASKEYSAAGRRLLYRGDELLGRYNAAEAVELIGKLRAAALDTGAAQ